MTFSARTASRGTLRGQIEGVDLLVVEAHLPLYVARIGCRNQFVERPAERRTRFAALRVALMGSSPAALFSPARVARDTSAFPSEATGSV